MKKNDENNRKTVVTATTADRKGKKIIQSITLREAEQSKESETPNF